VAIDSSVHCDSYGHSEAPSTVDKAGGIHACVGNSATASGVYDRVGVTVSRIVTLRARVEPRFGVFAAGRAGDRLNETDPFVSYGGEGSGAAVEGAEPSGGVDHTAFSPECHLCANRSTKQGSLRRLPWREVSSLYVYNFLLPIDCL
jgi:hypothetical protein